MRAQKRCRSSRDGVAGGIACPGGSPAPPSGASTAPLLHAKPWGPELRGKGDVVGSAALPGSPLAATSVVAASRTGSIGEVPGASTAASACDTGETRAHVALACVLARTSGACRTGALVSGTVAPVCGRPAGALATVDGTDGMALAGAGAVLSASTKPSLPGTASALDPAALF